MLTNLQQQPADALLALIKLHNADPRVDKIDLGVGVYKTGQGDTPVFASIKAAEKNDGLKIQSPTPGLSGSLPPSLSRRSLLPISTTVIRSLRWKIMLRG